MGIVSFTLWESKKMGNVKNQFDNVAQSFEELVKAVENAPYNFEVEKAIDQLRDDLRDLGIDIQR